MRRSVRCLRLGILPALLLALAGMPARGDLLLAHGFDGTTYEGIWDVAGGGAGGANLSRVIAPNTILGLGAQSQFPSAVADDFTVAGSGWIVDEIRFYTYQTGAAGFTFTSASFSLTGPDVNGTPLFSTAGAGVSEGPGGRVAYRASSDTPSTTQRPIYEVAVTLANPWTLDPGTYWLRWSLAGTAGSGPWVPPIVPTDGVGNARQSVSGSAFFAYTDGGSGRNVELPFMLRGRLAAVPEPASIVLAGIGLGGLGWLARRRRP